MKEKILKNLTLIVSIIAIISSITSMVFSISAKAQFDKQMERINLTAEDILRDYFDVTVGSLTIVEGNYSDEVTLPIKVTNKTSETLSGSITIEALDSVGNRITTDSIFIQDLKGGQSETFTAFEYESAENIAKLKTATFNISSASKY